MSSDQRVETGTAATIGKITCGDLVIHPTKPWPWIGTVQPKVGDFARLCTSCGGLRVPSSIGKDANTQVRCYFFIFLGQFCGFLLLLCAVLCFCHSDVLDCSTKFVSKAKKDPCLYANRNTRIRLRFTKRSA